MKFSKLRSKNNARDTISHATEEDVGSVGWGLKHTAAAGAILSIGQFLAVLNFFYPRTEAEDLKKQVAQISNDIKAVDAKHDVKSEKVYDKLEDIRNEIRRLIELQIEKKK